MPANYAHHRFGKLAVEALSPELKRPIQRFRRVYDVGLHGPDLLFYFNPFWSNPLRQLASDYHKKSGREFFTAACAALKAAPSEMGTVYLYGLLGHYCLDSVCHPYVKALHEEGKVRHAELETDFDRLLLRQDGLVPPHTQCVNGHMKLTRGECVTAAQFFPPVTPAQVNRSIRNMSLFTKLLSNKNRKLMEKVTGILNETVQDHVMCTKPNPRCEAYQPELCRLFGEALARHNAMLTQLIAHMETGAPLDEDFDPSFG